MTIAALDPDSSHPAFAVQSPDGTLRAYGGGSGSKGRILPTFHGICEFLVTHKVTELVCEDPNYWAIGVTPAALHGLYRVRFFAEASAEHLGISFVAVPPRTWQSHFLRGQRVPRKRGAIKKAYTAKAKALWTTEAKNEDRCAALAILQWRIDRE